jgi:hypothetical protein
LKWNHCGRCCCRRRCSADDYTAAVYDRSIHGSSESLELNGVDELYGNDHAPQLNYLFGNKTGGSCG